MKKMKHLVALFVLVLLTACSGSETYRGDWKAANAEGEHYIVNFQEKSFSVTGEDNETNTFEYSQNQVNISNGVETYGIKLGDGRNYQLNFPLADDESVGILLDANGNLLYTISRTDYMSYDDIFALD